MERPVSTKKKKKKQNDFPQSLGYTALGPRGMNDDLNNPVEYHCGQTPGTTFAAILQGRKSYFESKRCTFLLTEE